MLFATREDFICELCFFEKWCCKRSPFGGAFFFFCLLHLVPIAHSFLRAGGEIIAVLLCKTSPFFPCLLHFRHTEPKQDFYYGQSFFLVILQFLSFMLSFLLVALVLIVQSFSVHEGKHYSLCYQTSFSLFNFVTY